MSSVDTETKILLVVDDESAVCRALSRILGKLFDEVLTAMNPVEAETVLATRPVTHLVCDHWFGDAESLGYDLAVAWRAEHPGVQRLVLLTGTDTTRIEPHAAIDAIMDKTVDPEDLKKALNV
jgi:DNA-binding NtrC family response regulator